MHGVNKHLSSPCAGKPLCRETWCQITPQYTTIYVKEGQSEQIVCSIPDISGSTVEFVNQYGHGIVHTRGLKDVSNYVSFSRLSPTTDNVTRYQLNITWTDDVLVREQLKLLQCIANFQGRTNPCRTSVVFVDFEEDASKPGMFCNMIVDHITEQT